jgi:hypothetical protein
MSDEDYWNYLAYDPEDNEYFGCKKVVTAEWDYIRQRRGNQQGNDAEKEAGEGPREEIVEVVAPETDQQGNLFLRIIGVFSLGPRGTPRRTATQQLSSSPEAPGSTNTAPPDLTGLALSGGGIRSASFSLGIMQALAYAGWLKKIDYLSTVSGGGYIGSSLTWLLHRKWDEPPKPAEAARGASAPHEQEGQVRQIAYGVDRDNFPFGTYPMASTERPDGTASRPTWDPVYKGRILRFIRQHARYLTPGNGIDMMSLVAVVLRNSLFSLLAYGGMLVLVFLLLGWIGFAPVKTLPHVVQGGLELLQLPLTMVDEGYHAADSLVQFLKGSDNLKKLLELNLLHIAALAIAALFVLAIALYGILTQLIPHWGKFLQKLQGRYPWLHISSTSARDNTGYGFRHRGEVFWGRSFKVALFLAIVGFLPLIHCWITEAPQQPTVSQTFSIAGTDTAGNPVQIEGELKTPKPPGEESWWDRLRARMDWVLGMGSTLVGILSSLAAFNQTSSVKKSKIPMGLLVSVGTIALTFGFLLLAYAVYREAPGWISGLDTVQLHQWPADAVLALGLVVMIVVARFTNINYMSIHRYYRDRLMETFMPNVSSAVDVMGSIPGISLDFDADATTLSAMNRNPVGPYHIVNTNVVLVSSYIPKFRARGGDNFILSSLYCGSNATGWAETSAPSPFNDMSFATAMAISGAAVNPNTGIGGEGATRQPYLSFLMGILNIRLGYWSGNPTPPAERRKRLKKLDMKRGSGVGRMLRSMLYQFATWRGICSKSPNALCPGVSEIAFRKYLDENSKMLQLTDGGHFENLGLYELLRRRLKLIIVCDGGADKSFAFGDLANAIEKARADFGVLVNITSADLEKLTPRHKHHDKTGDEEAMSYAEQGYLIADITYHDPVSGEEHGEERPNRKGTLIYLTTTFFEKLSPDLYAYRKANAAFPDQPTSDQFFDDKQFEAYRELGYQTAQQMMCAVKDGSHEKITTIMGTPQIDCRAFGK